MLDQLFFLWKVLSRPARIDLVSGYRSAGTNAWLSATTEGVARNSLHTIGMAVDIRVPGLATEAVWRQAVDLRRGGVGLYRGLRLRPPRRGPGAKLGLSGTEHRLVRRPHEWWCFRLSVPIMSAVMAARS